MAGRGENHKGVKDLVEAARLGPRVWALEGVRAGAEA